METASCRRYCLVTTGGHGTTRSKWSYRLSAHGPEYQSQPRCLGCSVISSLRKHSPDSRGAGLLAELKLISCCKTWYSPSAGGNIKATEKRAAGLQADYRRKARDADKETRERTGDQRGPVERRLEEFGDLIGLVFGAWGEASEGVHRLIQAMAEARMRYQSLQSGKPGSAAELGVIVGQIRRKLSLAAVKAQTECLLAKLHQVGPGTAAMNKRRQWAAQEDERMRREREAQWLRRTEGIYTMRKGAIRTA